MSRTSLRRALATAALCASAVLLAACGSSTTESALNPTRFIAFGDAIADMGQNGSNKYTVNDGSVNLWLQEIAVRYGGTVTPSSAGGLDYAQASARITAKPDAAGNNATPTVKEQIDAFLASNRPADNDLVFLAGGTADLLVAGRAFMAGTLTQAQMVAQAEQAGTDLATQARRLVTAGSKNVVVIGPYDVSVTPWGQTPDQAGNKPYVAGLNEASRRFNDVFKVAVVDLGANLLYVDAAYYFNLVAGTPANFSLSDAVTPVCNSIDPGPGIGIGSDRVNSALCTTSTLLAGADYSRYMFADQVYTTPVVQRLFGDYAYDRIRNRW